MPHPSHLRSAAQLLAAILTGESPAGTARRHAGGTAARRPGAAKQMELHFRANRDLGVRDRGLIAETVYACLRHKRLLEHCLPTSQRNAIDLVAAQWIRDGMSARAVADAGYAGDAAALVACLRGLKPAELPFAVRTSLPDWLAERLLAQYGESEAEALAAAMNQPATTDLRVNTIKGKREEAQAQLAAEGIATQPTPYSPVGLRRRERTPLFRTAAFQDGWFEVQDEGSQLLAPLMEPRRGEMVVDFCAGAGGKTLHLGALMANTGTLYAFDPQAHRLERLKPRLARAGLSNVRAVAIAHERDDRVRRLHGKIDRVLVDAPCTGTGTLRRNPDIKWRELDLAALTATQQLLLDAAAELVKPGGRLVYATCSVLREENEAITADFLARHSDYTAVPVNAVLARRHVPLEMPGDTLQLLPHKHHTDGFYAAVLQRAP